MGKLTKERHGEELLRSLAADLASDPDSKSRVWSDDSGAWGLFGHLVGDEDELILWCCTSPGDRIHLGIMDGEDPDEVGLILGVDRATSRRGAVWRMRIMRNNGSTFEIEVDEGRLFRAARRFALGG